MSPEARSRIDERLKRKKAHKKVDTPDQVFDDLLRQARAGAKVSRSQIKNTWKTRMG